MWYKRAAIQSLSEQQYEPSPLIYTVDEDKLCPETYSKFIQLELDEGTQSFLDEFCSQTEGIVMTMMGNLLRYYYSLTDSNAILNRGQMHVLSSNQLQKLLTQNENSILPRSATFLDIGAGDGNVTKNFKTVLCTEENKTTDDWKDQVVTTELSYYMTKRLEKNGYVCRETTIITRENLVPHLRIEPKPSLENPAFDLVSLFNVIDRCDRPLTLLNDIKRLLLPSNGDVNGRKGFLLLAVVFPWGPFVESGNGQAEPTESLPVRGNNVLWPLSKKELSEEAYNKRLLSVSENINSDCTPVCKKSKDICACCGKFEDCLEWFIWNVLIPGGWEILQWSRVPYISAGDMNCRYYALENAVFVLTPTSLKL